jgi:putative SOS response-associated peptidase YedK
MCGRFVSTAPPEEIAKYFDAEPPEGPKLEPSFNIAPTNDVYAVLTAGGERRVEALHWGLVPFWAKNPSVGSKMINARAETLATKNAYRNAYKKKRCIIPADGFYEWAKVPGEKRKQPMFLHRSDDEPIAFAGLWEVWRNPDNPDEELHSCTIITGQPNDKVAKIHDRMPVMLPPSAWDLWLDPEVQDLDVVGKLLVPVPSELIDLYPVSTEVNNVRNKGAQLTEPAPPIVDLEPLGLAHLGRPDGEQGTLL